MLQEEWGREFNGIFIGGDVNCIGRLMVFFQGDLAYVAFEAVFEREQWRCSYEVRMACDGLDWDELVRLTPDDAQEYSIRRCSIIPKDRAWHIVKSYLQSGELEGLYLSSANGKPVLA